MPLSLPRPFAEETASTHSHRGQATLQARTRGEFGALPQASKTRVGVDEVCFEPNAQPVMVAMIEPYA